MFLCQTSFASLRTGPRRLNRMIVLLEKNCFTTEVSSFKCFGWQKEPDNNSPMEYINKQHKKQMGQNIWGKFYTFITFERHLNFIQFLYYTSFGESPTLPRAMIAGKPSHRLSAYHEDRGTTLSKFLQNLIPFKIYVTCLLKKWVVRITAIIIHVYAYFCCVQIVIHPRLRTHFQNLSPVPRCQSDSIHTNKQTILKDKDFN